MSISKSDRRLLELSAIERNLSLSYEERIEAHESARELMEDLKNAGQNHYAPKSESAPKMKLRVKTRR